MQSAVLASPVPRPEYPRPDRQRAWTEGVDWINLNGPWQFRFDPQRIGVEEHWPKLDDQRWREQIIVPFCWESLAAWGEADVAGNDHYYSTRVHLSPTEVTAENHRSAPRYEVGWYRREVEIPEGQPWVDKRVILTIGAADFSTECWCNDVYLGRREGGYLPLEFDLTDTLPVGADRKARTALIVLRVEDLTDNREQPVGKQWGWYTQTSGIWQTVFIEPRSLQHIAEFRITPDPVAGRVHFQIASLGIGTGLVVEIEIRPPEAPTHAAKFSVEGNEAAGWVELSGKSLWSPDKPQLYYITLCLRGNDGAVLDYVKSYFGLRQLSAGPGATPATTGLSLNGVPVFLRGALYQSYHPAGVYTALDANTLFEDITAAQRAGFNFLRIHLKLDDPLLLYYADTIGMLIMQDFPNFGEGGDTPTGRARFEAMMRGGIARDFNHPAIVAWCIFNETWGFGGQTELIKYIAPAIVGSDVTREKGKIANLAAFAWVHQMWLLAKRLDPTRLIEDMSVVKWEHLAAYGHGETDINSWHFYLNDYAQAKAHIAEVVAESYPGSHFNYIEGFKQHTEPLINSEYGGVGALDGDRDVSWSFKFLTNELRRHPQICAYIFTELTDVEWERNGFLKYDRTPKDFGYDPRIINQGDVLPLDIAPISRVSPGDALEVEVLSSHFSGEQHGQVALEWTYSGIDSLGDQHPHLARGLVPIPFTPCRVELAHRITLTAPPETMLCTLAISAISSEGKRIASNYAQHLVSGAQTQLPQSRRAALVLHRAVEEWTTAEWTGPMSTREDARTSGSCFGEGQGYFEWVFSDAALDSIGRARRIRILLELSSHRSGIAQTNGQRHPSSYNLLLNGIAVHEGILPDHPHDSRGALSYLHGGNGAYGYLVHVTVENGFLGKLAATSPGVVRLRCAVNRSPYGGLTAYERDCGRFPVGPTLVIDW